MKKVKKSALIGKLMLILGILNILEIMLRNSDLDKKFNLVLLEIVTKVNDFINEIKEA